MAGLTRETRLQIMLTDAELIAIDDWRFRQRMPSRAAAIRRLMQLGMKQEGIDIANANQRSEDFGVLRDAGKQDGA